MFVSMVYRFIPLASCRCQNSFIVNSDINNIPIANSVSADYELGIVLCLVCIISLSLHNNCMRCILLSPFYG